MFFSAIVYISVELTLTVFNGNVVIVESPITKMVVFLSGVAAVSNNTANREIKIDFFITVFSFVSVYDGSIDGCRVNLKLVLREIVL